MDSNPSQERTQQRVIRLTELIETALLTRWNNNPSDTTIPICSIIAFTLANRCRERLAVINQPVLHSLTYAGWYAGKLEIRIEICNRGLDYRDTACTFLDYVYSNVFSFSPDEHHALMTGHPIIETINLPIDKHENTNQK